MFAPLDDLRTARLMLRPPDPSDAGELFAHVCRHPEVTRFLTWPPHRDAAQTRTVLERIVGFNARGTEWTWLLDLAEGERSVGMFTCWWDHRSVELGFCLGPDHWGRGLLPEALAEVLDLLRAHPEVDRVWATTDVANERSARVLAAAGLTFTGVLPAHVVHPAISPDPRDSLHYELDLTTAR